MSRRVALVTDSTAMLPPDVVEARDITVVPLQVVVGATSYDEGVDPEATPATIAAALREWTPVSTSRPAPSVFLEAYQRAHDAGAEAVLSVHLSSQVSGTFESAQLAARDAPLPVLTVDTLQLGVATGFAVLTAAEICRCLPDRAEPMGAARARWGATPPLFNGHTLLHLRGGARSGAPPAVLGSALAVKPLLTLREGRIAPLEKVRTTARALSRLEELAVTAAADRPVDVAVAHLAAKDRAHALADRLCVRLAGNLDGREVTVGEVGAVIGAHVGPGMVAVVVAPR